MSAVWLTIIGLGEDGVSGLSLPARQHVTEASLVIGGARHLALADRLIHGARRVWDSPIANSLTAILAQRPHKVAVLASGDPFCFGIGPMLAQAVTPGEWRCLPAPSCLSLACAHLGWSRQDVETISFCGRPLAPLGLLLHPGTRILALSANATTPSEVAGFLCLHGFGASEIVLLEALGGPHERVRHATAATFDAPDPHPLNMLAITIIPDAGTRVLPLSSGLPDDAFAHDGQITKHEIRAATLAALAPARGALLWDIGTGSGSIAIEWLRHHPTLRAIAIDRHPGRLARAAANADALGVPGLRTIAGEAPDALAGLPDPDAVFIGGGTTHPGVLDTAWQALRPGGRIVVNAVTIETEALLADAFSRHGGTLTRIGLERLVAVGSLHGYRPAMTITQWAATKP